MNYLYIFENGQAIQSAYGPEDDDRSAALRSEVEIFRFEDNHYSKYDPASHQEWRPVKTR